MGGNFPPSESNTSIDPTISTLLCHPIVIQCTPHHHWEPTFHGMLERWKFIRRVSQQVIEGKHCRFGPFQNYIRKYMNRGKNGEILSGVVKSKAVMVMVVFVVAV